MLADTQRELIRCRGLATHHDHEVVSLIRGEASLSGGLISYFDGRAVFICGQAMRDQPPPSVAELRNLVADWLARPALDFLTYLGPGPVRVPLLARRGFEVTSFEPRIPHGAELFVELGSAAIGRRRRNHRAATSFEANWRADGSLLAAHFALIEAFHVQRELTEYLTDSAFGLLPVLTRRSTVLLEAWEGKKLRGFVAVHEPFERIVVGLFMARDQQCSNVGDFLYRQLFDYATSIGAEWVNLGPSPSASHYQFKRKWGGVPLVPPYFICNWRRRGCRSAPRTWMRRILRVR